MDLYNLVDTKAGISSCHLSQSDSFQRRISESFPYYVAAEGLAVQEQSDSPAGLDKAFPIMEDYHIVGNAVLAREEREFARSYGSLDSRSYGHIVGVGVMVSRSHEDNAGFGVIVGCRITTFGHNPGCLSKSQYTSSQPHRFRHAVGIWQFH